MPSSRRDPLAALLSLLLLSGCALPAYAITKEPYAQPTAIEAPELTFIPAANAQTEVRSYQDTKNCLWIVPLGGPLQLKEPRTIKIEPGQEFSFRTDFFYFTNRRCQLMTTFLPEIFTRYRARAVTDGDTCGVQLSRVVNGVEVPEPTVMHRTVRARGSCAEYVDFNGMPAAAPAPAGKPRE